MILSGTLYITNSYDLVTRALQDPIVKILDLDEFGKYLDYRNPNVIKSTCLLPQPEAVMAEIDGDPERFRLLYMEYLKSDVVMDFVTVILAALHKGINFIIFVPEMSEDSVWVVQLLMYFYTTYGIKIGTSETDNYAYDERYDSSNALLMYMGGFIDPYVFLTCYVDPIYPFILNKLIRDVNPVVPNNDYVAHFESMKFRLKANPLVRDAITFI